MKNSAVSTLSALAILLGVAAAAYAIGTSSSSWSNSEQQNKPAVSLYDQGVTAEKSGDYTKALGLFEEALKTDPKNPDVLNMLAHTQLKLGRIDDALQNYHKALELRPRFPEAREYLGETYIQAALREREILKGYGADGRESLEDLTKELQTAVKNLK